MRESTNERLKIGEMSVYPTAEALSKIGPLKLPLRLMFVPGYNGACICESESEIPMAVGDPDLMRLAVRLINTALELRETVTGSGSGEKL